MLELSEEELDALVEQATLDAYNEEEQRDGQHQGISILDLPLPESPPKGAEWIAAYRRWARYA